MSANIGRATPRIVIPQRAVSQTQGVSSIWVMSPDSTVSQRSVKLGSTYGSLWAIDSGLEAGEVVLLTGQLKMHKGSRVKPKWEEQP